MLAPFRVSGSPAVVSCKTGKPGSASPEPMIAKMLLGAMPEFGNPAGIVLELLTIEVIEGGPGLPDPGPAATPKVVNSTVSEVEEVAVTMTFAQCAPLVCTPKTSPTLS